MRFGNHRTFRAVRMSNYSSIVDELLCTKPVIIARAKTPSKANPNKSLPPSSSPAPKATIGGLEIAILITKAGANFRQEA